MTLKGSHKLIDALLYLKISGSLVVASTEVSECMCVCVRVGVSVCVRACLLGRVAVFVGLTVWIVCVCVQERVSRFALPFPPPLLPVSIVEEENPPSQGGWGKSDVSGE